MERETVGGMPVISVLPERETVVVVYRSFSLPNFGWLCAVFLVFFGSVSAVLYYVIGNFSFSPTLIILVLKLLQRDL